MNYKRFLNDTMQQMEVPIIQQIFMDTPPDVDRGASLGLPNPEIFALADATFNLKDGTQIRITEDEMTEAQQYGKTAGLDKLVELLYKMQCDEHQPPTASLETGPSKMRLIMAPGAQMAILTCFLMFARRKTPILFNTPSFAIASAPLIDQLSKILCVDIDEGGTSPSSLRANLAQWSPQDAKDPESDIPRILWLNPTCINPAGVTTTPERRKEIYAIAQEYDLLIVEDDPYYHLQEVEPRVHSYLSLDVDGRVLRFDSFSKTVSPGLRCASITGPQALVTDIEHVLMQGSHHTSMMSQMILYKLMKHWGPDGFEQHVHSVVKFNRTKRMHALENADKWLTGLAEWHVPPGGMYILFQIYGTGLTSQELNKRLIQDCKVTMTPACGFYPKSVLLGDMAILRISTVMDDEATMEKAIKGLAEVIKQTRTENKLKQQSQNCVQPC